MQPGSRLGEAFRWQVEHPREHAPHLRHVVVLVVVVEVGPEGGDRLLARLLPVRVEQRAVRGKVGVVQLDETAEGEREAIEPDGSIGREVHSAFLGRLGVL